MTATSAQPMPALRLQDAHSLPFPAAITMHVLPTIATLRPDVQTLQSPVMTATPAQQMPAILQRDAPLRP